MAEFLLEIRSEEIPARMQVRAGADLRRLLEAGLKAAGLAWLPDTDVTVFTGPRRIGLAGYLPERSPDVREERKGPRVGSPDKALQGFMRGAGLSDISEAEIRSDKKGDHYVAIVEKPGRDAAEILSELIPSIMADFPWPKSMKSGGSAFRWVRPLRGIISLLDGDVIPVEVGGIQSGNVTHGHRQMGPGPFTVTGFSDCRAKLEGEGHVLLDHDVRKEIIREKTRALCKQHDLDWVEDEGLLDEVAGLVEYPVPLLGDMDPEFLKLPVEVIRLTLKSHQKTFTVRDKSGALAPHFIIIANLETADQGATIKAGNAKVISARLSDALFFQDQDRKQPLVSYFYKLDTVVFHKKLGSVRDKAERVMALAREIAPLVGADPDVAEKAAKLAKCDLVTQTVIEMTSLQGQVGRMMYEDEQSRSSSLSLPGSSGQSTSSADMDHPNKSGDDKKRKLAGSDHASIARAIEEHYKPQGPSDAVPTDPVSVAVALADKLDTLVGFWAIDEKPTGSKDPYALRRAALGVVRILTENHISLNLLKAVADADVQLSFHEAFSNGTFEAQSDRQRPRVELLQDRHGNGEKGDIVTFWNNLLAFLQDRLRVYLRDHGHRHDVIDAVLADGGDDLLAIAKRVEALGALLGTEDGENLVQGYKRAANILRAERKKAVDTSLSPGVSRGRSTNSDEGPDDSGPGTGPGTVISYTAPEAADLAEALNTATPAIDTALENGDYPTALDTLAGLRAPIDTFFEGVMVNSDVADERARRLGLLIEIEATFRRIADFSRLDG